MKPVNIFIATEQHARFFSEIIKELDNVKLYTYKTVRSKAINAVLESRGISEIPTRNFKFFYRDMLTRKEIFISPLNFGQAHGKEHFHPVLRNAKNFDKVLRTPVKELTGSSVIFHECLSFPENMRYSPHCHVVMTQTSYEQSYFEQHAKEADIVLVGNLLYPFDDIQRRKQRDILIATTYIASREDVASTLLNKIIHDIGTLKDVGDIYIKPHPANRDKKHFDIVRHAFPDKKVHILDKFIALESLPTSITYAFTQSSVSTYLALRSMGVRAYLYQSLDEEAPDPLLIDAVGLRNIRCDTSEEEHDALIRKAFHVNNRTKERFIEVLNEL